MEILSILLVDNEESDFARLEQILRAVSAKDSYKLERCTTYTSAINAMLKSHYDAYLVNETLEGKKGAGIELLHEAIGSNCTQPIIILSEQYDQGTDDRAMITGASAYFAINTTGGHILDSSIRYAVKHNRSLSMLKASEDKFRIIFERSKDPMFITDINGNYYDANDAVLEYLETTRAEFLKANAGNFYSDSTQRDHYITEMEQKGYVTGHEVFLDLPSGKRKHCSISSFLQISQHGSSNFYYTTLHDLTSLKIDKRRSPFPFQQEGEDKAAYLADEIRNPLTAVNLAVDEIGAQLHDQPQSVKYYLDILKENCDRISQLTTMFYADLRLENNAAASN